MRLRCNFFYAFFYKKHFFISFLLKVAGVSTLTTTQVAEQRSVGRIKQSTEKSRVAEQRNIECFINRKICHTPRNRNKYQKILSLRLHKKISFFLLTNKP